MRNLIQHNVDPSLQESFAPSKAFPLRCTLRPHFANTEVQLHSHAWAQMVFSSQGVVRVSALNSTYTVPPWRAVWIPARTPHTAYVLEDAQLHSLHLLQSQRLEDIASDKPVEQAWLHCRVLDVRPLLRELVVALADEDPIRHRSKRYGSLCTLALLEIRCAPMLPLGVALPSERRLRALCATFLQAPRLDRSLGQLATEVGASISTINRLFQSELGSSFSAWRRQVLLAQSFALAAKGLTVGEIAFDLGYSSPSAYTSMVTKMMGVSPSQLLRMNERHPRSAREEFP